MFNLIQYDSTPGSTSCTTSFNMVHTPGSTSIWSTSFNMTQHQAQPQYAQPHSIWLIHQAQPQYAQPHSIWVNTRLNLNMLNLIQYGSYTRLNLMHNLIQYGSTPCRLNTIQAQHHADSASCSTLFNMIGY